MPATSLISQLRLLPTPVVQSFLKSKNAVKCGLSEELGDYILEINDSAQLLKEHPNLSDCAKELMVLHPEMSLTSARRRVSESIAYFNTACDVTAEVWNLYFADEMMTLYKEAMKDKNVKEARLCLERAREYRIAAAAQSVNPDLIKYKEQLVSPDVELDRMGIRRENIITSYKRALEIIDSRDISSADKERLKRELEVELNIEDADES